MGPLTDTEVEIIDDEEESDLDTSLLNGRKTPTQNRKSAAV
jgi:hypothetical protein